MLLDEAPQVAHSIYIMKREVIKNIKKPALC